VTSAAPTPTAAAGVGAPLDPAAVAGAVRPLLTGGALGRGTSPTRVVDVATGAVLFAARDEPTTPASTMKLVTAVAVLDAMGPDATVQTRTVLTSTDATTPRVIVVGGGDPSLRATGTRAPGRGTTLRTASMAQLARATARALQARGIERVRLSYDASLFTGPAMHPTWDPGFPAAGIVAPVSALQVDEGRRQPTAFARVADPAAAAAGVLAAQLEDAGIDVRGEPKRREAPADAAPLASVDSPTIGDLVERTLATSNNDMAEALGRLGALAAGEPASFAGVAAHARATLEKLGIATEGDVFADGSGLSRRNALRPATLAALLQVTSAGFGPVGSGLPVAAATGSLQRRFDTRGTRSGAGLVRAKTGTLTGVVGLAGYVSRPDGRLLSLVVLDDSVPGGGIGARAAIDRAVAALVSCDCAAD
jgi:D-alanyl-D-alanine carboxypeptidase/D-alanyl-D-alanine-endopeptidase (penicillin-binding protein 4)